MTDLILEPDSFDFLVDHETRTEHIIGLRINPLHGPSTIVPLNAATAEQVADLLLAHVRLFREQPTYTAASPAKARMLRYQTKAGN
jgi:hypothetical protein